MTNENLVEADFQNVEIHLAVLLGGFALLDNASGQRHLAPRLGVAVLVRLVCETQAHAIQKRKGGGAHEDVAAWRVCE